MEFCQCCKLPKGIVCTSCKVEKSTNNFYPNKLKCKSCISLSNKKKYVKRPKKEPKHSPINSPKNSDKIEKNENIEIFENPKVADCESCQKDAYVCCGHCRVCKESLEKYGVFCGSHD